MARGSVALEVDLQEAAAGQVLHVFFQRPDGRGGGDALPEHDQFVREGRLAEVGQLRPALGISARCAGSSGSATGPSYSRSFVRTR